MVDNRLPEDHQQRQQALDVTRSFIVQAPAGSGKTGLLTQRLLALLATVQQPEDILAITFTRKARGEMLERVLHALEQAASANEQPLDDPFQQQLQSLAQQVLLRSKTLGWQLLEQPSRLRILTIDAFNASLTRQLPVLSQYGAQPVVSDNAEQLYRLAVQRVLMAQDLSGDHQQQVYALLTHTGFQQSALEDTLVAMLAKREQWLGLLQVDVDHDRESLESLLALMVCEQLQRVQQMGGAIWVELLALGNYAAENCCLLEKPNESAQVIAELDKVSELSIAADGLKGWQAVSHLLLTADGKAWRKPGGINKNIGFIAKTPQTDSIKSLLTELADDQLLLQALQALRLLPKPEYSSEQWQVLQPMLITLQLCLAELLLVFREQGTVDHIEMASRALRALTDGDGDDIIGEAPSELALKLDAQIKHILVDEFQDTSLGQIQLLNNLTAGWQPNDANSVFLVGDPMQSIYRFRKAEVGIFLSVWQTGLGEIDLQRLQLSVNFRTQQALVEWNNIAFDHVLPSVDDLDSGAVRFANAIAWHAVSDQNAVQVWAQTEQNPATEAMQVVDLVRQGLLEHVDDKASRIAILVRRRKDAIEILKALQLAGIAYQAMEMATLEQTPEVRDLLSLTQALLHPADRLSWLSVLRAPWCGLQLNDLLALSSIGFAQDLIALEFDQTSLALSADGIQRWLRIQPILNAAIAARQHIGLRQLVMHTWQQLGGPACYTSSSAIGNAEQFFALLGNQEQSGDLEDPVLLTQQLNRLFALPDTSEAAVQVQVMTIHKAKGLEFDHVILPGLGHGKRFNDNDRPLLISESRPMKQGNGLLLGMRKAADSQAADPIYQFINNIHKQRDQHEAKRLLYVATTRARHRLYLLGHVSSTESKTEPANNSAFSWLWPVIEPMVNWLSPVETNEIENNIAIAGATLSRLTNDWQAPVQSSDQPIQQQQNQELLELEPERDQLAHAPLAIAIGRVVHRALEALAYYGESWWLTLNQSNWLMQQLRDESLIEQEKPQASKEIQRAIENTLQDEKGQWILQSHTEAHCEYALNYFYKERLATAIIDRTFIDDEGQRWIIDYKTSLNQEVDLATYLRSQVERYQPQLSKYKTLMQAMDTRPIKMALYFPLLKEFVVVS